MFIVLKIFHVRNWMDHGIIGETMAKKKLRSNALYFNFGLAVIWDVIGFFFFILSLFAIGIPFSVVLDIVAVGSALLFRYLHKAYFFKTSREIKADFKAIEKAVRRSKKKAIAQQYAKARAQLDLWVDQGLRFIMREIIRMLMTFLLELIPFLGDFSPTWSIKAYFELYKFGQQKKKYQLLLYQIEAMEALLKAEEKFAPGYAKVKRGFQSAQRIADGDFSQVKENIPGRKQYQSVKKGVQNMSNAANTVFRVHSTAPAAASGGYQQSVGVVNSAPRYNEVRSQGQTYYHEGFRTMNGTVPQFTSSKGAFQPSAGANITERNYSDASSATQITDTNFQEQSKNDLVHKPSSFTSKNKTAAGISPTINQSKQK